MNETSHYSVTWIKLVILFHGVLQRLTDGADEYLQLLDVASNVMRAVNNMSQEFPFGA